MSARLAFEVDLAFGQIELRCDNDVRMPPIPAWLVKRPDVIAALAVLATKEGVAKLDRASADGLDAVVDLGTLTISLEEPVEL